MSPDDPMPDHRDAAFNDQEPPSAGGTYSAAVGVLFQKKNEELKRFLTYRLGSAEEARDVAQEAYARLLTLDRTDTSSLLLYRLWRIATNLAKDRIKLRAIRRRIEPIALFDPIVSTPSPEPLCVAHEQIELVRRALKDLPPRCQLAFTLRMFDDLPFEDIAKCVGVDLRTAKRYVARAMAHCQHVINTAEDVREPK